MTGMLESTNTRNLFRMVSELSSARPSLRPSSRCSMTSSGQSKKMMKSQSRPITSSNALRFSELRGNPSIRNFVFPLLRIASCSSPTVTSEGTICPCCIISATLLPSGVPERTWARSSSPALKCAMSENSSTSFVHCVPFPEPGPPSTNTMVDVSSLGCCRSPFEEETVSSATTGAQWDTWSPELAAAAPKPKNIPSCKKAVFALPATAGYSEVEDTAVE
mmetsp:Transcript_23092/g.55254  ORF Transcript_23092/g.55254 Transcript_23092/m.55254 type:complete len:220 (+) Transcript_23092:1164-1823(+)